MKKCRFPSVKTVKLLSRAVANLYGQDRAFICPLVRPFCGRISAFLAPIAVEIRSALRFVQRMRFGHIRPYAKPYRKRYQNEQNDSGNNRSQNIFLILCHGPSSFRFPDRALLPYPP